MRNDVCVCVRAPMCVAVVPLPAWVAPDDEFAGPRGAAAACPEPCADDRAYLPLQWTLSSAMTAVVHASRVKKRTR
jgi:hypothetical protein